MLQEGDEIILCGLEGGSAESSGFYQVRLSPRDEWTGQKLADLSLHDELILLIRRGEKVLIPSGDTVLRAGDELVAAQKRP